MTEELRIMPAAGRSRTRRARPRHGNDVGASGATQQSSLRSEQTAQEWVSSPSRAAATSSPEGRLGLLGWAEMSEQKWSKLVERGLPPQISDLSCDLGQRNERPIRVYTMPMMEAGVAGFAVPFINDDGILFDTSLLDRPTELVRVMTRELSCMMYPGWPDSGLQDPEGMAEFAANLAAPLLRQLPTRIDQAEQMVLVALNAPSARLARAT